MGKLIAVAGSPGSGKTLLSLAVAGRLALQKKNVILVNTDKLVPHLKVLLPAEEPDRSRSVGPLLLQSEHSQKQVAQRMLFHPESNCLGIMAFAPGDTPIAYPPLFEPGKVMAFLNVLSGLADYVIVDGTSNPVTDSILLCALEQSGRVLCALTPDRKGVEYLDALLPVLRDEKYHTKDYLRVLSPVREQSPAKEIRGLVEDVRFLLPHADEAEERMLSGKLLRGFGRRAGLVFETRIKEIVEVLQ